MSETDSRLANRILIGLLVGAAAGAATLIVGAFAPGVLTAARWLATNVFDPFGQVFLRLLFFVVMPLVFASLASGVVQLGHLSRLGPLAGRTFLVDDDRRRANAVVLSESFWRSQKTSARWNQNAGGIR